MYNSLQEVFRIKVGERIKTRRKELKISADDIANKLGVSRSTIFRYEKGDIEKMPTETLNEIARILHTTPQSLMGWYDSSEDIATIYNRLNTDRQTKVYNYAQHELEEQNKVIDINEKKGIYLQSKVSAGTGVLDLDPTYGETISYDGEIPNHYDLAFLVSGNSMEPIFEDGEIIFVEKYPNPINGALMVVQIDGEAFIKKVYLEKDNLRLVSLNQDYDDILANGTNNIRIVGKVVF